MTLPTDSEVVALVEALYQYPGDAPVAFDHIDPGADTAAIYWAAKRLADVWLIIPRGSVTTQDFERDAWAVLTDDPDIGFVHAGFMRGVVATIAKLKVLVGTDPWMIAGHSLGAAHADLIAAKALKTWTAPLRYVRFGEPRAGLGELAQVLAPVPGISYRAVALDGHDEVTDLAPAFPLPYEHPQALVNLCVPQMPQDDPWGLWRYHHIQLYRAALA